MANKSLTGLESLIKLLPTGTLFIYLLLNPVLTNDGTGGSRKYGIVTRKGLWTYADPGSMDLSKYKLRIADFVHAGFVVAVFGTLVLLDANTASCFYPRFRETQKTLVMVLPVAVGIASAGIFAIFPSKRNGLGYAPSGEKEEEETKKDAGSA
ncbi:hypothetical protein YC2023_061184 [Brassica napus]